MFRFFQPDLSIDSVLELSPEKLQSAGLRSLLLDVDCTLKHYRSKTLPAEVAQWLETMRQHDIGLCLVSNGRGARIRQFAETVRIPFVAPAMKPLPFGCWTALRTMGFEKKSTAMVGDQVFADLLAGKLAGLYTVLVRPMNPEEEPWFTRLKRPFEKIVLRAEPLKKQPREIDPGEPEVS